MKQISRQLKLQNWRKKQGLCPRCGKNPPFASDGKACEVCLIRIRVQTKALKDEIYHHYGGYECSCCGEHTEQFLTLDHKNNDGAMHRALIGRGSGHHLYRWIKRNNFPSIFQVLCFNCNCGRQLNGGVCPHKI